jgi:excinuclease UvrABC helicase subunit UvrB
MMSVKKVKSLSVPPRITELKRDSTIFEYLPKDAVIVFDEVRAIDDKLRLHLNAHKARVKAMVANGG